MRIVTEYDKRPFDATSAFALAAGLLYFLGWLASLGMYILIVLTC